MEKMKKNEKILSPLGKFLYHLEFGFCKNFRRFVGRNEKTIEIFFLILFFILQGILAIVVLDINVALLIILFLFILAIERVFIHIGLDYEREMLDKKEKEGKEIYERFRMQSYQEINYLTNEIIRLEEKLKALKNQR